MIIKSSHPLSPAVDIVIDSRSVDYTSISGFTIELTENEHDAATITMQGVSPYAITDYLSAAVALTIDSGVGRKQTFYGYIVSAEPEVTSSRGRINNSPIHTVNFRCLGASYVMKDVSSRVWDYPTLGAIISEIARKHEFSASYPQDMFKPTRLTQANESDWAFLRRVMDTYGYCISAHGTHLSVWDPLKAESRLASFHPLITGEANMAETPGAIIKFDAFLGHHSSTGDSSKASITTLSTNGTLSKIRAEDSDMKQNRSVIASMFDKPIKHPYRSFEEGMRAVQSAQRKRPVYEATAEVTAGAGIVPGGIVFLTEYGTEVDGLWYVSSVTHRMGNSMYTTDLKISKHNKRQEEPLVQRAELFSIPPAPVLIGRNWVASNKKVTAYV